MKFPTISCGASIEEAHRRVSELLIDRYDGHKGITVYAKNEIIDSEHFYGSTRLYGEKSDGPDCYYCEPDVLIEQKGEVCTIIEIDAASTPVSELIGKATTPLLSKYSQPRDIRLPLRKSLHFIQIICTLDAAEDSTDWECKYRSLESDVDSLFRSIGNGCRYSLVMPVHRKEKSVEKVLINILEKKIW